MSEFSHLKNKLLAEQVEDQIYHYILDEALEPGAKLPNEFALGEKFRVGRSTIREAVKLLSSKGIVEVRQGSGTYVVTTVKGLSDPLNLRSVQDKNALAFDLVNVRLLLEPGIAEMAAQNATPEDIERLRRLCERVETKIHEGDRYIEDDIAFHTCIAESSKNLVVGQLIPVIDTAVMMFVNVTHKKLIDETIMTHRMITEAIANHDPLGAKAAMVMHLNFNRSYIKKVYDGEDPDDIAFHTCIAESSKNMVVEQLIPIIDTAVMMFVNVTHKKLTEETILTHRMITEAIARHDPIGARSAMVMHLNFNRNCIRKLYDGEWET